MRLLHLVLVAVAESAIIAGLDALADDSSAVNQMMPAASHPSSEDAFPSLTGATTWLNSPALTPDGLRGKVVLVDFWTYSCINWLRAEPYVRAWAEKYKDHGLVVIGVHSPEFSFEKELGNVRRAARALRVDYPVAVDNDHAVWRAFKNQYWPALYFIDARGSLRHQKFGEGSYEESEKVIQQLLAEAGKRGVPTGLVSADARGAEADADWNNLKSSENYVGFDRTENFASPGGAAREKAREYAFPARLDLNHWALLGSWAMGKEATVVQKPNGRIAYRFHARDLHIVMGPGSGGVPVRFRVTIDGKPPGVAHGVDLDDQGLGKIVEPRMYQLIRQPRPIVDRQFEIEFLDAGAQVYSFTFG